MAIENYLFKFGGLNVLIDLDKRMIPIRLANKCGIEYSYTHEVVKKLVKGKLVKQDNKEGRSRPIELTEKGKEIRKHLLTITKLLNLSRIDIRQKMKSKRKRHYTRD